MATFPTGIADGLHSPITDDTIVATDVSALVTEILSIEAKVGKNNSAVTTSHDYLLTHLPAQASDVDWDAGAINIQAENFTSDIATGTRPLIVTSTTVCTNLNADLIDGKHVAGTNGAGEITTNDGTQTLTNKTLTSPIINGGAFTGGTDIAVADGGTGASTAADARTNLGLGTIATQAANNVAITGGSVTGITDLAIADGGTGSSTKNFVDLTTEQTVAGVKTFSVSPVSVAPTTDLQLSTKKYVDDTRAKVAGDIVQIVNSKTTTMATGTTAIPYDDSIPQNTEGTEFLTASITPISATNNLLIEALFNFDHSDAGGTMVCALFQDSTAGALACSFRRVDSANVGYQIALTHYMAAGTTSSTTFKIRMGALNVSQTTINGINGSRRYGGIMVSSITITEIKV